MKQNRSCFTLLPDKFFSQPGVKLLLVNARLSERSATLWSLPFSRRLFTDIIGSFKSISPQVRDFFFLILEFFVSLFLTFESLQRRI